MSNISIFQVYDTTAILGTWDENVLEMLEAPSESIPQVQGKF